MLNIGMFRYMEGVGPNRHVTCNPAADNRNVIGSPNNLTWHRPLRYATTIIDPNNWPPIDGIKEKPQQ